MENKLIRKNPCMANSDPPSLAMHKDLQTISKTKPKIRIIHIFAPEIIKTDAENFRELVQRLTGKPSNKGEKYCKKKPKIERRRDPGPRSMGGPSEKSKVTKKIELRNGFLGLDQASTEKSKEEEGLCNDANSGGYLAGFSDLEGFISEFAEFPLLPLVGAHMQGFEEPQLS